MVRTILIGGNRESYLAAEVLNAHPECAVVGQVVPGGRLKERTSDLDSRVHSLCQEYGVAVHETQAINGPESVEWMSGLGADLTITLGWSELYREELLGAPLGLQVGSHPSALPYGRGRAPIPWTILEGLSRSAVTLFEMNSGVDAGPILRQEWFDIGPWDHATEVYDSSAAALGRACVGLLEDLREGALRRRTQDETRATYRHGRRPEDGLLDFSHPASELSRLVRAVSSPYPGAFFFAPSGAKVVARRTAPPTETDHRHRGVVGQVLRRDETRIVVQASDGPLVLGGIEASSDVWQELKVDARLSPRGLTQ